MLKRTPRPGRHRRHPVALIGAFGIPNFGNNATLDAAMYGVLMHVTRDEILCICSTPEYAAQRFGVAATCLHGPPRRASRVPQSNRLLRVVSAFPYLVRRVGVTYRQMRNVDTAIFAGTGALDDQHTRAGGLPLDMAIWSVLGRLAGARVVLLSVGAGPISSRASRMLLRLTARAAHEVSYRDELSRAYMASVGRDVSSDRLSPDLVFGWPQAELPQATETVTRSIGIGVMWGGNWDGREQQYSRYLAALADVVEGLWRRRFAVTLLIGDGVDVEARSDLQRVLDTRSTDITGHLDCPSLASFEDVLRAIAGCSVVVASRYHNVVAALILSKQVVSLQYGFKNEGLLSAMGLGNLCFDIDTFVSSDVVQLVETVSGADTCPITGAVSTFRADLTMDYARLLEMVHSERPAVSDRRRWDVARRVIGGK